MIDGSIAPERIIEILYLIAVWNADWTPCKIKLVDFNTRIDN